MIRRTLRLLVAVLMLSAGLGTSSPAMAQAHTRGPAPELYADKSAAKVDVRIMVVHATSSHSNVDSRLQNLTKYLKHLKYTGYDLLQTQNAQLAVKGKQSFSIEGGAKVSVELLSKDDSRVRMRVQITRGSSKLLDTTLSVNRNGTFIVAGPKHKGGILVLPLTARY